MRAWRERCKHAWSPRVAIQAIYAAQVKQTTTEYGSTDVAAG